MFALTEISRNAQRAICMLMAAVIVAAGLSLGAFGAQYALNDAQAHFAAGVVRVAMAQ
jgi:hypothetical protein